MCARLRTTKNEGRSVSHIFSHRFTSPNHDNVPKPTHARREFPAPNRSKFASSRERETSHSTRHSVTSRIAFNSFACNKSARVTRHLFRPLQKRVSPLNFITGRAPKPALKPATPLQNSPHPRLFLRRQPQKRAS